MRHNILQQAHAPGSRVPNLDVAVAGLADVWLSGMDALERNAALLDRDGGVASFAVKTYRFI